MNIEIIYETPDFLAINKPAGVLVHQINLKSLLLSATSRKGLTQNLKPDFTLVDWLLGKYPEVKNVGDAPEIRPGIVHRLDKDTSGVILICRNQKFFEYAKKIFQEHKIKKNYLALANGEVKPKNGIIEKPISIKSGSIKRTIHKGKDEKAAITEYQVLNYFERNGEKFSYLKVMPKTGRTHQIRIHLASIGHPIVGDSLYGKKENSFGLNRQFLHAESLEFNLADGLPAGRHGRRIKIEADLPQDLQKIIDSLK
ncbi:RluA family pseudouridine synthase [Candidatus Wolfebacteria bacterium]|nr:RluA family pseudouridine synthase [Candidatus Wolfebacteria bacterium]